MYFSKITFGSILHCLLSLFFPASYLPNNRHVSEAIADAAPDICKHVILVYENKNGKKQFLFIYGNVLALIFCFRKKK